MLEKLNKIGFIEHCVKGSSMMPFIRSGSLVIIEKFSDLKKGDCALFEQEGKLILHRVKKVKENGYVFIGDNSYKSDGFILKEKVYGKLSAIYSKNKTIECNGKKFKVLSSLYNYCLFRPFNVFFMRLISKIKK